MEARTNSRFAAVLIAVVLPAFFSEGPRGEGLTERWVMTFDGQAPGNAVARAIALDPAGDIVVAGERAVPGGVVLRYSPGGRLLWTRSVDTAPLPLERVVALALDGDGNAFILGDAIYRDEDDPGANEIVLAKVSPQGLPLWTAVIGEENSVDWATGLAVDGQGNAILVGSLNGSRALTAKYDQAGNLLWEVKTGVGPGGVSTAAVAVAVDRAGNIFVAGHDGPRASVLAFDAEGKLRWEADGGTGLPTAIGLDASGAVYLAGVYYLENQSQSVVMKVHPDGTSAWLARQPRGSPRSELEALLVSPDGTTTIAATPPSGSIGSSTGFSTANATTQRPRRPGCPARWQMPTTPTSSKHCWKH